MNFQISIVLIFSIITIAKCNDLIIGHRVDGKKIFDEKLQASPAIWRQSDNVTVNATNGEVIGRIVVTDLRETKDGEVQIVSGNVGQESVTLELKSPTALRGYEFKVEVYSVPNDGNQKLLDVTPKLPGLQDARKDNAVSQNNNDKFKIPQQHGFDIQSSTSKIQSNSDDSSVSSTETSTRNKLANSQPHGYQRNSRSATEDNSKTSEDKYSNIPKVGVETTSFKPKITLSLLSETRDEEIKVNSANRQDAIKSNPSYPRSHSDENESNDSTRTLRNNNQLKPSAIPIIPNVQEFPQHNIRETHQNYPSNTEANIKNNPRKERDTVHSTTEKFGDDETIKSISTTDKALNNKDQTPRSFAQNSNIPNVAGSIDDKQKVFSEEAINHSTPGTTDQHTFSKNYGDNSQGKMIPRTVRSGEIAHSSTTGPYVSIHTRTEDPRGFKVSETKNDRETQPSGFINGNQNSSKFPQHQIQQ